jgi:hypothetical protein
MKIILVYKEYKQKTKDKRLIKCFKTVNLILPIKIQIYLKNEQNFTNIYNQNALNL